jgi:hypothetical protein
LEKEKKATAKERAARLERILLKDKMDLVLGKGPTPAAGKWNNTDLKVTIQWFKRDGDKATPKNKEGLILRYRETHTHVVDDTSTYPHEELDAAVALVASTVETVAPSATCTTAAAAVSHTTARSAPTRTARSAPTRTARSAAASQDDLNTFDIAADGDPDAPHASPLNSTIDYETRTTVATTVAPSAIVQSAGVIVQATGGIISSSGIVLPPALDWDDCDATFDVRIQLNFHAPAKPLCPLDSDNDDASSSSDDDSIFIDLLRD